MPNISILNEMLGSLELIVALVLLIMPPKLIKLPSEWHTFDIFLQHVVYDGVDILIHIFEQEGEAIFDGHLQLFQEVTVIECAYL